VGVCQDDFITVAHFSQGFEKFRTDGWVDAFEHGIG
jgi:hypothetical protein